MKIQLPYGESTITAELPAGTRLLSNVERAALPPVDDLDGAVRAALAAPCGLPRIGALARPGAMVTIAFDDHTTGSFGPIREVAIRAVLDELEAAYAGIIEKEGGRTKPRKGGPRVPSGREVCQIRALVAEVKGRPRRAPVPTALRR